jgi:hypothetical protein
MAALNPRIKSRIKSEENVRLCTEAVRPLVRAVIPGATAEIILRLQSPQRSRCARLHFFRRND